jgi:nucleoside-diphosphate-sugar epimerase
MPCSTTRQGCEERGEDTSMRILITGATGFVGHHTVGAALERGHGVRALIRPSGSTGILGEWVTHPALDLIRVDLRAPNGLAEALEGVDTVIHLAAAKTGDFHTQFAGTVVATENLLAAMTTAGVDQLVGVSTFSVYDFQAVKTGGLLDETSPIDRSPARRDEYARTKLVQEELYRAFAQPPNRVVIVRPGMIYGRDHLWHALLGAQLGPLYLRIGSRATLPLTYVENCAEALVMAAEQLGDDRGRLVGQTINIVDDHLPTQAEYVELVSAVVDPPTSLVVPWLVMRGVAGLLDRVNELLFDGRARFPGLVVPARLHARFKPLRYTNAKAKRVLGWAPRYTSAEAVARSSATHDPATMMSGEG